MPFFPIFLVAVVALVVAMHRGITRSEDERLRTQFQAEGEESELSRQLMHASGYGV
ncbi:hypothetical protein [Trinickia dinghuensis]|uniref:hypothetical protein n=1 Tax=Trinickia dinghuensis TaxID=2291023 RepID=UPI0015F1A6BF|nr:hypothetical protein [Trinickia dinghuensis]